MQEISFLTKREIRCWNKDGYLLLKGLLGKEKIVQLKDAVRTLQKVEQENSKYKKFDIGLDKKFIIQEDKVFLDMMDCDETFQYVLGLMGPCVQLCMSHAIIRPSDNDFPGFIHTDGGQSMNSIRLSKKSRPLQIKIQYFLTDVQEENGGNFVYVPRSHTKDFQLYKPAKKEIEKKMKQIKVKAGDVLIFPSTLWHGSATNRSTKDRISVIYGYNHSFMRAYDYSNVSENLLERCTLRQRRLLGDMGSDMPQRHYYLPKDQVNIIEGI